MACTLLLLLLLHVSPSPLREFSSTSWGQRGKPMHVVAVHAAELAAAVQCRHAWQMADACHWNQTTAMQQHRCGMRHDPQALHVAHCMHHF
jgi:hypothetical protein